MSNEIRKRLAATITGRVQGVGYRYFAEAEANRLGLTGYARNLSNGDVEVIAEGESEALEIFLGLLRRGPRSAEVEDVRFSYIPATSEFGVFSIRGSW